MKNTENNNNNKKHFLFVSLSPPIVINEMV